MRPQAPRDPPPKQIELPSGPLSYTETGNGPAVVAIHGLPATSRDFRWLDAALDDKVRFFRVDLPGFGRSPPRDPEVLSYAAMGRLVVEFCERMDLQDVILLGHSLGGGVVVDAATRTDRVARLVLVNSSGPIQHRGNFARTYRLILAFAGLHRWAHAVAVRTVLPIARWVGFSKHLPEDSLMRAARLASVYEPATFATQLGELDKPVLVVWSSDDPAVQSAVPQGILSIARHGESLPFDAKSHNLQSSHATELAAAILALKEVSP